MDFDLLDLYGNASECAGTKVSGATSDLDAPTTCDGWTVRTLMNHVLETQRYFVGSARGDDVTFLSNHRISWANTPPQTSIERMPRRPDVLLPTGLRGIPTRRSEPTEVPLESAPSAETLSRCVWGQPCPQSLRSLQPVK